MATGDNENVLVPQQSEVEVYLNPKGDVVFKRDLDDWERNAGPAEDAVIIIPHEYVARLIERLEELKAEVEIDRANPRI